MQDAALSPGTDVRVRLYPLSLESPRGCAMVGASRDGQTVELGVLMPGRQPLIKRVRICSPEHLAFIGAIEAAL